MRRALTAPDVDAAVLQEALRVARELYRSHEAGAPTAGLLEELSSICGTPLDRTALLGAFGSIDADDFATDLVVRQVATPTDLSRAELIELVSAVSDVTGTEWQTFYWLRCLEANTGGADIVSLIYYPDEVLGPDDERDELTPEEVIDEALKRPRRVLVTPPPDEGGA
jgi:hypothetical protein